MKIFLTLLLVANCLYGTNQKDLAIEQYRSQNIELAFETYAKALAELEKMPSNGGGMGKEESELYKSAMKIYANPRRSVRNSSEIIKSQYEKAMQKHPNYYHLGYLLALAYANLGQFDRFFQLFYDSYKELPNHYLAYKGMAILHSKLYERARNQTEKEKERALVLQNLSEAKKINPRDVGLYRMEIIFSENSDQDDKVAENVKKLMQANIVIPKTDLPFFFDELIAHRYYQLALELTKKAREWYPYNRTLDAVEEFINRKQSLKE